jgi:hypothetical protein
MQPTHPLAGVDLYSPRLRSGLRCGLVFLSVCCTRSRFARLWYLSFSSITLGFSSPDIHSPCISSHCSCIHSSQSPAAHVNALSDSLNAANSVAVFLLPLIQTLAICIRRCSDQVKLQKSIQYRMDAGPVGTLRINHGPHRIEDE